MMLSLYMNKMTSVVPVFLLFLAVSSLAAADRFLPFDYDIPAAPAASVPHRHASDPAAAAPAGAAVVAAEWAIRLFQIFVSPQDGPSCMYSPTCSRYGYLSVSRYGFFTGMLMAGDRWLRCNPFGYPGEDQPEDNYFGPLK